MAQNKQSDTANLDPDVRFILANERTLLAWVRTGLTLQAGGFALAHFSENSLSGKASGIFAIVCGGIIALIGYARFKAADKAIRSHQLPKTGKGPTVEVLAVVLLAIILAAIQIVSFIQKRPRVRTQGRWKPHTSTTIVCPFGMFFKPKKS